MGNRFWRIIHSDLSGQIILEPLQLLQTIDRTTFPFSETLLIINYTEYFHNHLGSSVFPSSKSRLPTSWNPCNMARKETLQKSICHMP
ncbi:hypothetical protein PUN28_012784 [Cardiocondyla obscurior]|uniref:Uncharacterized protein n=1 Tax=Cardiocondyla obscurior TaxID=286306 RepID=A0AAW2F4S0_9HYME